MTGANHRLVRTTRPGGDIERVFAFFKDPRNLDGITENSHFADEQQHGPYSRWYHRHTFRVVDGGVEMTDDVDYRLPSGPLGRLVHWLIVRHQLRAIFDYRTTVIEALLGAPRRPN